MIVRTKKCVNSSQPSIHDFQPFRFLQKATAPNATTTTDSEIRRPSGNWRFAIGTLLLGLALGMAGITFWFKTGNATIQVDSEVDDIVLQLIKDGTVAKEIQVHPGNDSAVVRVGRYELKIADQVDNVRLDQDQLLLMRGDRRIVRVWRTTPPDADPMPDAVTQNVGDASTESTSSPSVDENQPTSRGRTYQEWKNVVLRERDPQTVLDAIDSLEELDTPGTHAETFATLLKVAEWNESRASREVCDLYIGYLTTREKLGRGPAPAARGRRGASRPKPDPLETAWKDAYPQPADSTWSDVVNELTKAIAGLPNDMLQKEITRELTNGSDAAKRILLATAVKRLIPRKQDGERIIAELDNASQPAGVRALATHLRLESNPADVRDNDRKALADGSAVIAKAVLSTLLRHKSLPFPEEQGLAAGRIANQDIQFFLRDLAKKTLEEPDSEQTMKARVLLRAAGKQMVRTMDQLELTNVSDLYPLAVVEMLACAGLLDNEAQIAMSEKLRQVLSTHTSNEYSPDIIVWTSFVAHSLLAIDGKVPRELRRLSPTDKAPAGFDKWKNSLGDRVDENSFRPWFMDYPLESIEAVLEHAAEEVRGQKSSLPKRSATLAYRTRTLPRMLLTPPNLSLATFVALQELDPEKTNDVIPMLLDQFAGREMSEVQLLLPLPKIANGLLRVAEATGNGYALRLAQVGGADDARVQEIAISHCLRQESTGLEDEGDVQWNIGEYDFAWLTECLANSKTVAISMEQAQRLNDRLVTMSFAKESTSAIRAFKSMLLFNSRVGPDSDREFRVLRGALGDRDMVRTQWRRGSLQNNFGASDFSWTFVARTGQPEVVRCAVEQLQMYPVASEAVLKMLNKARGYSETEFGGRSRVTEDAQNAIAKAIASVEKAIETAEIDSVQE